MPSAFCRISTIEPISKVTISLSHLMCKKLLPLGTNKANVVFTTNRPLNFLHLGRFTRSNAKRNRQNSQKKTQTKNNGNTASKLELGFSVRRYPGIFSPKKQNDLGIKSGRRFHNIIDDER